MTHLIISTWRYESSAQDGSDTGHNLCVYDNNRAVFIRTFEITRGCTKGEKYWIDRKDIKERRILEAKEDLESQVEYLKSLGIDPRMKYSQFPNSQLFDMPQVKEMDISSKDLENLFDLNSDNDNLFGILERYIK